jgi:16S rRNA (adenine1518-N6/adenine1519-N6)-dimethyltransferase
MRRDDEEGAPPARVSEGTRLRRRGLVPKRRFGQHFLFNPRLLDFVIEHAGIEQGTHILEVGPGSGALTRRMLARGAHVIAVEIDRGLCELLRGELAGEPRFELLECDVLEGKHRLDGRVLAALEALGAPFKLVANLPFNAATPLLVQLLEQCPALAGAVVTVQDEVADRFVAVPGTRDYGTISVLAQAAARVRKLLKIGRQSFSPPPKVDAAVLELVPLAEGAPSRAVYAALKELVACAFAQRRKKLRARVAACWPSAEELCPPDARPEEVEPAGYLAMAHAVANERARGLPPQPRGQA